MGGQYFGRRKTQLCTLPIRYHILFAWKTKGTGLASYSNNLSTVPGENVLLNGLAAGGRQIFQRVAPRNRRQEGYHQVRTFINLLF